MEAMGIFQSGTPMILHLMRKEPIPTPSGHLKLIANCNQIIFRSMQIAPFVIVGFFSWLK
jgi:hypothetical protein